VFSALVGGLHQKPFPNRAIKDQVHELGMEEKLNQSQINAIVAAMGEKVTLISGPPGTGKTKVLAGIVTNWHKLAFSQNEKILVCCSQNYATDLCAEILGKIPIMGGKIVRIKSQKRSSIFKLNNLDELNNYDLLFKMLFMDTVDKNLVSNQIFYGDNPKVFKLRYQLEFYFGDYNYSHDRYLLSQLEDDGYISIYELLIWKRIEQLGVSASDFPEAVKNSLEVELNEKGDKIRKRAKTLSSEIMLLGFTKDGIDDMTVQQFN